MVAPSSATNVMASQRGAKTPAQTKKSPTPLSVTPNTAPSTAGPPVGRARTAITSTRGEHPAVRPSSMHVAWPVGTQRWSMSGVQQG